MQVRQFVADDRAVSPVIGVILMVAITVILAAVIGAFVLSIGQGQQRTPATTFDYEYGGSYLEITHTGGDSLTSDNSGAVTVSACSSGGDWLAQTGTIVAGTTFNVSTTSTPSPGCNGGLAVGQTVRIIWTAPGGGKTQTIGAFEVPS